MTDHTGVLDHALAEALHTSTPHADSVEIKVLERALDGVPSLYRAVAWVGAIRFSGRASTATAALADAMTGLRAGMGGAI